MLKEINMNIDPEALTGNMTLFKALVGSKLFDRLQPYLSWQDTIRKAGLWYFEKASTSFPGTYCEGIDDSYNNIKGINFASQDYLNLSSHPEIKQAAINAVEKFGVHSAGSPALFGNTKLSLELEEVISKFTGMEYVTLFPTGWGAGYGVINGLLRANDHIIIDVLSHACLQEGARAATKNIHSFRHLDNQAVENKLKRIRERDKDNTIMVVTESLFSMDSDNPNLTQLQEICRNYDAYLMVDMAHDLGCIGEKGQGVAEKQNMVGKLDIVMGSFSKTFASNGGFIATNSRAVREYLTFFSGPRAFSNALSPVQAAVVLKAFNIIQSEQGKLLRDKLMSNSIYLRKKLVESGLVTKGNPSAIIPIIIGNEGLTRIVVKQLIEHGIITNIVEYPGVPKEEARLRIQIMADHTENELDKLVYGLSESLIEAKKIREIVAKE